MNPLDILNTIPIEDYSASCGDLEYVHIEDSKENRKTLKEAGATDEEIEDMVIEGCDGILDITYFPFSKLGAEYWSPTNGFTETKVPNYKPSV